MTKLFKRYNFYFWLIFLPLIIGWTWTFGLVLTNQIQLNWILIFISWFMIGPVGLGLGFHRLFSHRQFETYPVIEKIIAILGTLAAYSPVLFFAAQHNYHHINSDDVKSNNIDPSSPNLGFWESLLWWRMRSNIMDYRMTNLKPVKRIMKDRFLVFLSRYFVYICWITFIILFICGSYWLVNLWLIPILFEHVRINLINSVSHINIPGSYRTHFTNDSSQNNWWLGIITMGFAYHNTHHACPRQLILSEHWWEIDTEGRIGWILSKIYLGNKSK